MSYLGLMLSQFGEDFDVREDRKEKGNYNRNEKRGNRKSRENSECMKPFTIKDSKKQTTRQWTRLKVTVCLYLNPSNSARSLSTLIAVAVVRENAQKNKVKKLKGNSRIRQFPLAISAAKSGWTMLNANTKISHSQAAEQTFCGRMNRRHFVKRHEDQSVAECCGESKKNVQRKN